MADCIIRAFLPDKRLQLIWVSATEVARQGRSLQQARPGAAGLFAQTLTASLLLGALQRGDARLNLQIECDGPVRGLFADAKPTGEVRGYIKNTQVETVPVPGPFRARGALGRRGYVSVLRDVGGEIYRGAVDLDAAQGDTEVADLIHRYFEQSEQVETGIALTVRPDGAEILGRVAGILIQALPDGDRGLLRAAIGRLRTGWLDEVPIVDGALPERLAELFEGEVIQPIDTHPALYRCGCSRERALRAVTAMGREEIADLWEKEGKAEATCEFCGAHYVIPGEELLGLIFPPDPEKN